MINKFTNLASGSLKLPILATDTTLTLQDTEGAHFPALSTGEVFQIVLTGPAPAYLKEVCTVTGHTGVATTLTVARASEAIGYVQAAYDFPAGTQVEMRLTASALAGMVQIEQLRRNTYTYYVATGAANTYAITPGLTTSSVSDGTAWTVRAPVSASNTGASTLAVDGLAAAPIKLEDGSDPYKDAIMGGRVYDFVKDGANYILRNPTAKYDTTVATLATMPQTLTATSHNAHYVITASGTVTLPDPAVVGNGYTVTLEAAQTSGLVTVSAGAATITASWAAATSVQLPGGDNIYQVMLVCDGTGWRTEREVRTTSGYVEYLTAGTYQVALPKGVRRVKVWGEGAGGGGYWGTGAGGAGAWCCGVALSLEAGPFLTVVVGAGGAGGGGTGGSTTFAQGGTTLLTLPGGTVLSGGATPAGPASTSQFSTAQGGTGPVAGAGANGTYAYTISNMGASGHFSGGNTPVNALTGNYHWVSGNGHGGGEDNYPGAPGCARIEW